MTDDEKFLIDDETSLQETKNMLMIMRWTSSLGFQTKNTFIIYDVEDIDLIYDIALEVASA